MRTQKVLPDGESDTFSSLECLTDKEREMQINLEDYYRKYAPLVLRRCRQLLKNEADAADALQETFVKLIRYQNRLTAEAPSSLLYRMATNVCLNQIRDGKQAANQEREEVLLKIAITENLLERFSAGSVLQNIFNRVPETTRSIAVFFYVDQMTLEEIAEAVQLSVSGVRKRLQKLKDVVEKEKL